MPFIESVDELAEELADYVGAYGAHTRDSDLLTDNIETAVGCCRVCFVEHISKRIRTAVANERGALARLSEAEVSTVGGPEAASEPKRG